MTIRDDVKRIISDRGSRSSLVTAGMIAPVPIIGQFYLFSYAVRALRDWTIGGDDARDRLPEWRWDLELLMIGVKCQLLMLVAGIVAGLLTMPLWLLDRPASTETETATAAATPVPSLIAAFDSPAFLVTTAVMSVFSALLLVRYATTGSAFAALDIVPLVRHLRAEPMLWIAASVIGFTIADAPIALAWLLPLSEANRLPVLMIATALFWPLALLVQARLTAYAFRASSAALARRRPFIVKVSW